MKIKFKFTATGNKLFNTGVYETILNKQKKWETVSLSKIQRRCLPLVTLIRKTVL